MINCKHLNEHNQCKLMKANWFSRWLLMQEFSICTEWLGATGIFQDNTDRPKCILQEKE